MARKTTEAPETPDSEEMPSMAFRVSAKIVEGLLKTRVALAGVEDDVLVSTAMEAAAAHGLTWRLCESAAPQPYAEQLIVFQFRADLLHIDGDMMLGHDIINVAVQPRVDKLLSVSARAEAHFTFVKSVFGLTELPTLLLQTPLSEPAISQQTAATTETAAVGVGSFLDSQEITEMPAELADGELDDAIPDVTYLVAQTTPDDIPILADLWELMDANPNLSTQTVCEDTCWLLTKEADTALEIGHLSAAWERNKPAIEFVRDYDHVLFDELVQKYQEAQTTLQQKPEEPKKGREQRRSRRMKTA